MPTKKELIASEKKVEEIKQYLEVDSLGYLSIEGLLSVVSEPKQNFCAACFNGEYPVPTFGEKGHC
jgi:amidophosphoribosyltransferase